MTALDLLEPRLAKPIDFSQSFTVEEAAPMPVVRFAPAPIACRRVSTFNLVLDTTNPGYACRNNLVVDPDGYVVTEDRITWDAMGVSRARLEPTRRVQGTVAYLSNTDVTNFAHWICLTLPLLRLYREHLGLEPDFYYVGHGLRDYHLETLALAGIQAHRVLCDGVTGDRLVAILANRRWGAPDTAALRYARAVVAGGGPSGPGTRRLLVGRGRVRFRQFLNEAACADMLREDYGFEHVTMDGLTVAEEVKLFGSAEVVVGVTGAALTNLLWLPKGTPVVEIMAHDWIPTLFMEIASHLGCPYGFVVGEPPAGRLPDRPLEENLRRRSDIFVDLGEIRRALAAMGVEPRR